MATRTTAEEHLRVIRSLMEKSTIYRAISAPTALVGGLAGILAAAIFHFQTRHSGEGIAAARILFLECWLGALMIAAVGNIYFLRADAARRGEKFVSAGMRAALRALLPSYVVAAVLAVLLKGVPELLPIPWMLLYGLSLLSTQHFAPRSIALLGWTFLIAGLIAMVCVDRLEPAISADGLLSQGSLAMGATFGIFHLIYAVCAWPRRSAPSNTGNAP